MSSMLHVRMDDELKAKGNAALKAIGLTAADAVRILYHRIVAEQGFPLELKVPNATTQAAMDEAERIIAEGRIRFKDADEMFAALDRGE